MDHDEHSQQDASLENPDPEKVGWSLDVGQKRQNNEDSLATASLHQASASDRQSVDVYAVADGMGGHADGEIASKLAVRTAIRQFMDEVTQAENDMPENYRHWLRSAASIANRIVFQRNQSEGMDMGTTLVMAAVVGNDVHVVNVGDSRAYIITRDRIRQITKDHSLVQLLVDAGAVRPQDAPKHPQRNVLVQSVGKEEHVGIDSFQERIDEESYLLLCSDGLWDELTNEDILRIVNAAPTAQAACEALVEESNQRGGHDNIAVVLARIQPKTEGDPAPSKDDSQDTEL